MQGKRRKLPGELKAKAALEAPAGEKTINEIASKYEVHPNQVSTWKKQLQEAASDFFADRRARKQAEDDELQDRLYRQIGQLHQLHQLRHVADHVGPFQRPALLVKAVLQPLAQQQRQERAENVTDDRLVALVPDRPRRQQRRKYRHPAAPLKMAITDGFFIEKLVHESARINANQEGIEGKSKKNYGPCR